MKKLILAVFFMIFSFGFAEVKNISDIKTLDLIVREKTFLNKKKRGKSLQYKICRSKSYEKRDA